ncbi:hypothetical protein [Mycolicibacillus parakoreensis]|uniref:Uncharacterized protein n=1 Tax=Mycolicibacillus parakoreensis TaxID=1069221 RepID=A0ABY3U1F0_9MYCO|nr:hypothetical protein [Mycolicibacillus parakoreensis]ULN53327.1 hypothetical protein MIU77_02960 [Mycolicibacillus parakoreensis]
MAGHGRGDLGRAHRHEDDLDAQVGVEQRIIEFGDPFGHLAVEALPVHRDEVSKPLLELHHLVERRASTVPGVGPLRLDQAETRGFRVDERDRVDTVVVRAVGYARRCVLSAETGNLGEHECRERPCQSSLLHGVGAVLAEVGDVDVRVGRVLQSPLDLRHMQVAQGRPPRHQ